MRPSTIAYPFLAFLTLALGAPAPASATPAVTPRPSRPTVGEATRAAMAASNDFDIAMYARLPRDAGNVLFSAPSLRSALGIAYLGAKGETKDEMARRCTSTPTSPRALRSRSSRTTPGARRGEARRFRPRIACGPTRAGSRRARRSRRRPIARTAPASSSSTSGDRPRARAARSTRGSRTRRRGRSPSCSARGRWTRARVSSSRMRFISRAHGPRRSTRHRRNRCRLRSTVAR